MKKLMFLLVLVAIGFMFSGCSDMNQDITSANQVDKVSVPFKGNLEGEAITKDFNAYPVPKLLTISGTATHVGKYTSVMNYDITYTDPENPQYGGTILNGDAILIAANGDEIWFDNLEGDWWFSGLTDIKFTMDGEITGGTGRFINATGIFNGTGSQVYDPYNDPTATIGSWTGNIQY